MAFPPSAWKENFPTGTYVEGLDQALGRFCAFAHADRVDIFHFERLSNGRPISALAEISVSHNSERN